VVGKIKERRAKMVKKTEFNRIVGLISFICELLDVLEESGHRDIEYYREQAKKLGV